MPPSVEGFNMQPTIHATENTNVVNHFLRLGWWKLWPTVDNWWIVSLCSCLHRWVNSISLGLFQVCPNWTNVSAWQK